MLQIFSGKSPCSTYHVYVAPRQIVPEGDLLLRFVPETSPEEIFFENALTGDIPARLAIEEVTEFGHTIRQNQVWISVKRPKSAEPKKRISFQCNMARQLFPLLEDYIVNVKGRFFNREANTNQVRSSGNSDKMRGTALDQWHTFLRNAT